MKASATINGVGGAPRLQVPGLIPAAILLTFIIMILLRTSLPEWAVVVPKAWIIPFVDWINAVVEFLRKVPIFFGLFTFRDLTRALATAIEWPLDLMEGILITGFPTIGLPALPWIMVVGLAAVLGWWLKGWRLALLAGGCIFYVALFGKWKLSMITLSVVLVAAPVAGLIALGLGILAFKWRPFEHVLMPVLNVMQSLPHFSYLIPVSVFIGVSHRAGAIATILFAIPPMARLTLLGLRGVSKEVVEAGIMGGSTEWQLLWKVQIPAARDAIMVGVNQVIMQCLAMVVIASFVGAKGLGHDLLFRLQSLRIGQALEIGVAIVFIAVMLDRLSLAWSEKQPVHKAEGRFWQVYPYWTTGAIVVIISTVLALITPLAQNLPKEYTVTTAPFWDAIVDGITIYFHGPLSVLKDGLLLNVLIPLRSAFQAVPWIAAVFLVGSVGWILGGWRLALTVAGFILFLAFSGYWERALITAYMVAFAVFLCVLIGVPIGIWAGRQRGQNKVRPASLRHLPDLPILHLPDPGDHAVPGRRRRRDHGDRDLRQHPRHPLHHVRPAQRCTADARSGDHVRLHALAGTLESSPAARLSRDHAWHQPDHYVCPLHGDHRRLYRH